LGRYEELLRMSVLATLIPGDENVGRVVKQTEKPFGHKIPRYSDDNAPYPFDLVPQ